MTNANDNRSNVPAESTGPRMLRRSFGPNVRRRARTLEEHNETLEKVRERRRAGKHRPLPPRVGTLAKALLKQLGMSTTVRTKKLHAAWAEALDNDAELLRHTRLATVRGGALRVEVSSPSLRHDLAVWKKEKLLRALNRALGPKRRIIDIDFTLGPFPAEDESAHRGSN